MKELGHHIQRLSFQKKQWFVSVGAMPVVLSNGAVVRRQCDCDNCTTDRKTEEFFTKKRYWWSR